MNEVGGRRQRESKYTNGRAELTHRIPLVIVSLISALDAERTKMLANIRALLL